MRFYFYNLLLTRVYVQFKMDMPSLLDIYHLYALI